MSFGKAMGLLAAGAAGGVGKGWQQKILQDRQAAIEEGRRFFQKEMIQTQHENAMERDEKNFERSQSLQPKPPTFGKTEQNPETGTLWQQNLVTGKWSDTGIKFVSEGGGLSKEKVMDTEIKLHDTYHKGFKEFQEQAINVQKLEDALMSNSGAGDYAAIISFVKSLDPTSVVREGEADMASNVSGLKGKLEGFANQLKDGERLTPKAKAQYLNLSRQWLTHIAEAHQKAQAHMKDRANKYSLDPLNIIGEPFDFSSYTSFKPIGESYFKGDGVPDTLRSRGVQTQPKFNISPEDGEALVNKYLNMHGD